MAVNKELYGALFCDLHISFASKQLNDEYRSTAAN